METLCSISGVCLHVCSLWPIKAVLFILMLWVLLHAVVECLLWAVLGQHTNKSGWIDVWSLIQGRWYRKWEGKCHCHLDTIKTCRLFTEGQFKCSIIMQYPAGERPFFFYLLWIESLLGSFHTSFPTGGLLFFPWNNKFQENVMLIWSLRICPNFVLYCKCLQHVGEV